MATASFGSISSGTMRPEDLIREFANTLDWLDTDKTHVELIAEADAIEDFDECEAVGYILEELFEALNEFAPAYANFGAHPGDGADYGFWLIEDLEHCFDGLKVDDTADVPADYSGEVLHVNDHGNVTLYSADKGELTEIWALV